MSLRLSSAPLLTLSRIRGLFVIGLIIAISIVLSVCQDSIIRLGWQVWTGKQIEWRGATIPILRDHFVFPTRDNEFLLIGRFDDSDEVFPNTNHLFIAKAEVEFDLKHLPSVLLKMCKKTDCKEFKEYSFSENGVRIICVEFKGVVELLNNSEFHVFCRAQRSDILVEYHGNTEEYVRFKEQQQAVIKNITRVVPQEQ